MEDTLSKYGDKITDCPKCGYDSWQICGQNTSYCWTCDYEAETSKLRGMQQKKLDLANVVYVDFKARNTKEGQ